MYVYRMNSLECDDGRLHIGNIDGWNGVVELTLLLYRGNFIYYRIIFKIVNVKSRLTMISFLLW